jgi:protein tyrosine phosphatase (PTP) superfamily phosphohydrolase (DUF442 family)
MTKKTLLKTLRWILSIPVVVCLLGVGGYYVYVRYVTTNFDYVVRGQVYRSAQPSPGQLEGWIQKYGLKTIINLRGENFSDYAAEVAAAKQYGATLIDISLPTTQMPKSPQLMRLADALETAERPILLHCREGADRTSLASVMARMAIGGKTYERGKDMMSVKFLHVDTMAGHVASVLQEYEAYCRDQGVGTGGWPEFRHWVFNGYKPSYCYITVEAPAELSVRPGEEMSFTPRFVNRSTLAIPAGDPKKKFTMLVQVMPGGAHEKLADTPQPDRVPLPAKDISPGGEITMSIRLAAPLAPGSYEIYFDLKEETEAESFRHHGAAPAVCHLTVRGPTLASPLN